MRLKICALQRPLTSTLLSVLFLAGCATSPASREAAANVDKGMLNAQTLAQSIADGNTEDNFINASQTSKGALLGGTAGAITGVLTSGIGFWPGTATGMLLGASYGQYLDQTMSLGDALQNRGVEAIELGDQILVMVPSSRIFQPYTSSIKPQGYSTLALIARYVNSFDKMLVKVTAYTNDSGSSRLDMALTRQQANHVARAMQSFGLDARLLYAEGKGSQNLVANRAYSWRSSDNYRIEITLEKLHV